MSDFEDANSPTWHNMIDGQRNLSDAIDRTIRLEQNGKVYELKDEVATLVVRPRGWHLVERHLEVDGAPMSGVAVRLRPLPAAQPRAAEERRQRARTSTCRSSSRTARRRSGTASSSGPRTSSASRAARSAPPSSSRRCWRRSRWTRSCTPSARTPPGLNAGPLGLPLLDHQEARPPARVRAPGPQRGGDGRPVHARLRRAPGQGLPPPRRARDRRHGRVHPVAARPRGQRDGAREGARGQGARGLPGLRRHLGRPSRPRAGGARDLRPRPRRPAEPARGAARGRCPSAPRTC